MYSRTLLSATTGCSNRKLSLLLLLVLLLWLHLINCIQYTYCEKTAQNAKPK